MSGARKRNDTAGGLRCRAGEQSWFEKLEQEKVAEVIAAELKLETVFSATLGYSHDSGIVDKDVELLTAREELLGCFLDALETCEFQFDELWSLTIRVLGDEVFDYGFAFGLIAEGQEQLCSSGMQSTRCLDTETGRCSGDQYDFVLKFVDEVEIVDDLLGSRPAVTSALDVLMSVCIRLKVLSWGRHIEELSCLIGFDTQMFRVGTESSLILVMVRWQCGFEACDGADGLV